MNNLVPSSTLPSGRDALARVIPGAKTLDIAVAFVTGSGVRMLGDLFAKAGQPGIVRIVVRGAPITDPDAVIALAELGAEVRVVLGSQALRFHPKLWIVGGDRNTHVLSGSGNLTAGGLSTNYEQFELLHLPLPAAARQARAHRERWNGLFDLGVPVAEAVSSQAWAEWVSQQARRRKLAEELALLDRRLADTEAIARTGGTRDVRSGSHRRARADGDDVVWLRSVLQEAVGKRYAAEISKPTWGRRAEVNVGDGRGVRYLFLLPDGDPDGNDPHPAVSLRLYPGDTLSQARQLYPRIDENGRDRLVALGATPGWAVDPNFHLGVRTRGWLDDTSPAGLESYLEYWHEHIDEQAQRPADEWPAILSRLARQRIVSASYPRRFREEVGGRTAVHPRPGIMIARSWPLYAAKHLDLDHRFAHEVRSAVDHALAQIGERPLSR